MSGSEQKTSEEITGLRFRVTDLRRVPGSRTSEQRVVTPVGLAIGDVRVSAVPATVDVDIESLNDGVRVRATVEYRWDGDCRRCLRDARGTTTSEIRELFVDDPASYAGSAGSEEDDEEVRELDDGWVDLSESVRDALLLGLPLAPLCSDDCAGPSPEEFPVELEPDDPAVGVVSDGDPRWAALDDLRFDPEDS